MKNRILLSLIILLFPAVVFAEESTEFNEEQITYSANETEQLETYAIDLQGDAFEFKCSMGQSEYIVCKLNAINPNLSWFAANITIESENLSMQKFETQNNVSVYYQSNDSLSIDNVYGNEGNVVTYYFKVFETNLPASITLSNVEIIENGQIIALESHAAYFNANDYNGSVWDTPETTELKSITVSNTTFAFKSNVTEYTITVPAGTTEVYVDAIAKYANVIIEGLGKHELNKSGTTDIVLNATNHGTTDTVYVLHVKRKWDNTYLKVIIGILLAVIGGGFYYTFINFKSLKNENERLKKKIDETGANDFYKGSFNPQTSLQNTVQPTQVQRVVVNAKPQNVNTNAVRQAVSNSMNQIEQQVPAEQNTIQEQPEQNQIYTIKSNNQNNV